MKKHKTSFDGFQNGFLIPTENNNIENMGFVKLDFISDLEEIQIIKLPAKKMYKRYLNNEPWRDLSKFKLKVFNKN